MTLRIPVRQAPANAATEPAIRDLQQQAERDRDQPLRVTANQTLASTGVRLFDVQGTTKTDDVQLKSGIPNIIPHGLGKPVKHAQLTLQGDARWWLEPPPTGFDPSRVVAIQVSADVTAKVRVKADG